MTPSTTVLTMVDGARVVVPDSLELITPYVLREQQDWFEDEIRFLRRLLQPGQRAIDIGANYGVYTLSIAQAVGPRGKVWAFEPATSTASLLAEAITLNGFAHVKLEQSAVSSTTGSAELSLNEHSELNSLQRDGAAARTSETVRVTTLGEGMRQHRWSDIDFVKIDAEGEEANILEGGKHFFAALSPLVQYEIKAGDGVHLGLVRAFESLGYESYRLVPGLDLLIPFDADAAPDEFQLNLFCCKPDRATWLASRGFLLTRSKDMTSGWTSGLSNLFGRWSGRDAYHWRQALGKFPYCAQLAAAWERTIAAGHSGEVVRALSLYMRSRDRSLPKVDRFRALESSFQTLADVCTGEPVHLRLASFARVALDLGARTRAATALGELAQAIFTCKAVDPSEPFLAPGERFESLTPGKAIGDWVLAGVLEELERSSAFSSFYTGNAAKQRLEIIGKLGFASGEMERRLKLVSQRFATSPA